jgi:copper transport protein
LRRVFAAFIVAAFLWAVAAPAAYGHAIVRETRPAADQVVPESPDVVLMRFNEPVEIAFGAIRVYDTNGRRVEEGRARHAGSSSTVQVDLKPDLPDGTYTVTWRVVSADGHPIHEAFVFHVGQPGEKSEGIASELLKGEPGAGRLTSLLAGLFRFLSFATLLALGGMVAFNAFVWRDERTWRWAPWALALALVSVVALFVLQGALAGGLPLGDALSGSVLSDVADTRFGLMAFVRLGALAVFGLLLRLARRPALLAVPMLVALATPGLAGHAGTTSPVAVNVIADTLHMAAAAAWVGGLALLWRVAWPALAGADAGAIGTVVRRFSTMATAAVGLLVVTGSWRSFVEVRSLDALDANYGVVLLIKIGLFLPMAVLGFVNQRFLKAGDTPSLAKVRRNVSAETALAVAVLVVTALLVNLPPARTEAGGGIYQESTQLGANRLDVLVTPGQVGENEVHLTAFTPVGAPAEIDSMEVLFTLPDEGIGPIAAPGTLLAPGHFVVQGRQLSVAGRWVLEVVAKTGRFTEERTKVEVRVN